MAGLLKTILLFGAAALGFAYANALDVKERYPCRSRGVAWRWPPRTRKSRNANRSVLSSCRGGFGSMSREHALASSARLKNARFRK